MKYFGTNVDVHLGDRVIYKHLFWGQSRGFVAYLPNESEINPDIEYDGIQQWLLKLDNGKFVVMGFAPQLEYAHRRILFVERGGTEEAVKPTDSFQDEW